MGLLFTQVAIGLGSYTYICFDDETKAIEFEKYLKVGSGYAFAQRRLW